MTVEGRPAPRAGDDEISLVDLYWTLAERKGILLSVFAATLAIAVLYLVLATPTYQAQARLLLPKPDTLSLSTPDNPLAVLDPKTAFGEYQAQLKRTEHWKAFVAEHAELFPLALRPKLDSQPMDSPLKLGQDKSYPGDHVLVTFEFVDPQGAATILAKYLDFVRNRYATDLAASIKARLERKKESIAADIALLRQKAKLTREDDSERLRSELARLKATAASLREDEIARLKEDLALAKSLGITENQLLRSAEASRPGGDITIVASSETTRGYMRGSRAIESELNALAERKVDDPYVSGLREKEAALAELMKRTSDDPYIAGLRDLQIELERIDRLRMTPEGFRPYMQDGEIEPPLSPIRPKKLPVIAASGVGGLLLSVLVVLVVGAHHSFKSRGRSRAPLAGE